jgi:hypothetical protein
MVEAGVIGNVMATVGESVMPAVGIGVGEVFRLKVAVGSTDVNTDRPVPEQELRRMRIVRIAYREWRGIFIFFSTKNPVEVGKEILEGKLL